MKTTAILIGCLLVTFSACETHGPLKGVWMEANESLLPCFTFQEDDDTLDLNNCFPNNVHPDSILAQGFSVFPINGESGMYQLTQHTTKRNLHPIRVWKDGKTITLMGIHQVSFDTLTPTAIIPKGMLNNRLLIDCTGRPSELYVLWQNVLLPKSFFVFMKEGFATLIPIEAKSVEHSVLRIFAVSDSLIVFDSRVNLLFGRPVL